MRFGGGRECVKELGSESVYIYTLYVWDRKCTYYHCTILTYSQKKGDTRWSGTVINNN